METIFGISKKDLDEYNEAIAFLNAINNTDMILEAVEDKDVGFRRRVSNAVINTKDTMKMTGDIYGAAVDVTATKYELTTKFAGKLATLISKAAMYAVDMLNRSIKRAEKLITRLSSIPDEIMGKVGGDLNLYITVRDLQALYDQSVIVKLDSILAQLAPLTEGSDWSTVGIIGSLCNKVLNGKLLKDDIKRLSKIHSMVNNFENIKFTPTRIDMKDKANIDLYLSSTTTVSFKGLDGTSFEGTYMQGIIKLLDDINARQDTLKKLENALGSKYKNTLENSNFEKLSVQQQRIVVEGIRDISKAVALVAEISKYVSADITTLTNARNKINSYYKKANKK